MIGSVSQNQTIKIAGAISTHSTSYVVPANSYLLLSRISISLAASVTITFPGDINPQTIGTNTNFVGGLYLPAGTQLSCPLGAQTHGVLFSNSP